MPVKYKDATGYGRKHAPELPGTPRQGRHRAVSTVLPGKVKLGLDGNANVAMELGLREVDKALRLNVGHAKDDEGARKAYPPDTDFECWGWMSKKGGVRRNWLERFFHLAPDGVLTYYENCNAVGVKKGGSTKMRLLGVEEKGTLNLAEVTEIRLGTAPNATVGELELLTEERTFRLRVGRTAGGTKRIGDEAGAVAVWIACLNLARVAILEKGGLEAGRPLRSAIVAVRSALSAGNPSRESFEYPIDLAVLDAVTSVSAIGVGRGGAGPGSGFFKGEGGGGTKRIGGGGGGAAAMAHAAAAPAPAPPAPAGVRLRAPPALEEDVSLQSGGRPMTLSASTTGSVSGSPSALRKSSRSVSGIALPTLSYLYYEGQPKGADPVAITEVDGLLASGAIGEMTLVYADVEGFPFEGWTTWAKCKKFFARTQGYGGNHDGVVDEGEKCTSLFYVDAADISSFEIPYDEIAQLVEGGAIQGETLCYSDQDAWPFEAWEPWGSCNTCFGPGE